MIMTTMRFLANKPPSPTPRSRQEQRMDPVRRRRGGPAWVPVGSDGSGGEGNDKFGFGAPASGDEPRDRRHGPRCQGFLRSRQTRRLVFAGVAALVFMSIILLQQLPSPRVDEVLDEASFWDDHRDMLEAIMVEGPGTDVETKNAQETEHVANQEPKLAEVDVEEVNAEKKDMLRDVPSGLRGAESPALSAATQDANFKLTFVAGTRFDDPRRYLVGQRQRFRCPESTKDGPFLGDYHVNDGYCDCPQTGFDEPGTSACSGLTPATQEPLFYCGHEDGRWLPSSRVEDGVCDCCDGIDEGPGQRACKDVCAQRRRQRDEETRQSTLAQEIRDSLLTQYPNVLLDLEKHSRVSKELLTIIMGTQRTLIAKTGSDEYQLSVDSANVLSQRAGGRGRGLSLGKNPRWNSITQRLELRGGQKCPNGVARAADVSFECAHDGSTPTLLRVDEIHTCMYSARVRSPFGCILRSQ